MPDKNTYDAIIVGSGISGGWAAKELCEKGLKVLLLERGRNVEHIKDYPTATKDPWEFKHRLNYLLKKKRVTLFRAVIILTAKTINIFISMTRKTGTQKQNALTG
jgi:choline dehydrogenase-like flavoprotein